MDKHILILNAGSSSLKFSIYASKDLSLYYHGIIDNVLKQPVLTISDKSQNQIHTKNIFPAGFSESINNLLNWILNDKKIQIIGAGHRVVHGGRDFMQPQIITRPVIEKLKNLIPLAPLHQPNNIEVIETFSKICPEITQVACFDTEFHSTQPIEAVLFGIPLYYAEEGIIRYGFHGLSYEYIASVMPKYIKKNAHSKIIVAHLGNGASMCAMYNLQSIATTMGFTTLDGLIMGTRCGSMDPGVILFLLENKKLSIKEITDLIYKESGLKGISGISNDIRDLLASNEKNAKLAIELFCYHAAKQLSGLIPTLGGLDSIVFTGGIGENSPEIRKNICKKLEWLGVKLSEDLNNSNNLQINSHKSMVEIYVIHTNEEKTIALHTRKLIQ